MFLPYLSTAMEGGLVIPGLPEDIGLHCLARLQYKTRPVASRACRTWLQVLESPRFYSLRKQLGYTRHIACLLQSLPPPPSSKSLTSSAEVAEEGEDWKTTNSVSPASCVITVFDPESREWDRLPALPQYENGLPLFCQIASSEGKLIIMGGWDPVSYETLSSVFIYDFSTGRWRQGKDMPSKRSFFAIGSINSQIFIAGGHDPLKKALSTAWAFDVIKNEWTELTPMSQERDECEGIVIGNDFCVVSGYKTEFQGAFEGSIELYNHETGEWSRVENGWRMGEWPRSSCPMLGKDGRLISWTELDSAVSSTACGVILGEKCLVMGSTHPGEPLEFFIMGQDRKMEKMDIPYEFSGFIQSSCCVNV